MTPSKTAKPSKAKPARKATKKAAARARKLVGARDLQAMIKAMAEDICAEFETSESLMLLGIRTRGIMVAERLKEVLDKQMKRPIPLGILDITLYRDDLPVLGPQPVVGESEIPFDVTAADIVLVDDVLYTGRTIRAALDEIVDFGRPSVIRLAVLVDRGHREYPIQADYIGKEVDVAEDEVVRVHLKEVDDVDEVIAKKREV
ncbi:bifunctional pyr operon transcriptional regulator/uracil phosphoribosyltransferase PyrR [bacterium]|nr:bifunctional pyr operon transcriptional regulator/uracil phosphoribosyltransferase PyrR [bacterium]